jgi:hypothetical protein
MKHTLNYATPPRNVPRNPVERAMRIVASLCLIVGAFITLAFGVYSAIVGVNVLSSVHHPLSAWERVTEFVSSLAAAALLQWAGLWIRPKSPTDQE